ncbi:GNAT family N-acetyltransferase [Spirillospora sp. NPDC052269]
MTNPPELRSERLILRHWRDEDRAPFAALNADPEVMEYFPNLMTRPESDALLDRLETAINERGFGFWALEVAETGRFIGFTGLSVPRFDAHFTPTVEVGWRLTRESWGHGYASEAARRSLDHAFTELGLSEVVAFTAEKNARSRAVMHRIGMTHDPADDFDHPALPEGSPLRRHVLYRANRPA